MIFIKWRGNYLLHLVKEVDGDRNLIGKINGWIDGDAVIGKVVEVED